jgi:hypothetical protein
MCLKTMEKVDKGKDKKHVSFQGELRQAVQKMKLLIRWPSVGLTGVPCSTQGVYYEREGSEYEFQYF